ncbi:MAG: ABC transporter substrate-binding protein [Mesorhizobium sp.]|uniref:ABC transporter substrate-binding protein n=1 Tax=Mesorhizobium sp. TaxID=1871066 RepID=UPI000FE3AF98|nr:ABC transporter substrate-binding protein [Mesorhizobium sp.]RWJ04413.1 MAG: ABC transporter substrate-binding protein [Mesorhizobium sp.]RWJ15176.1 MAG: ABC transporter substrate-binding protein [Mesorhizobium sp.]
MRKFVSALCVSAAMSFVTTDASAVELTFAVGWGFEFYEAEIAKFEKATGNKVTLIHLPSSNEEKVSQYRLWLAARDKSIDVLKMDGTSLPGFANDLVDLTDATRDGIGQHIPAALNAMTVDGKLLAMPQSGDTSVLFYRKDLLEKYGKKPPKTWEELAQTAKEIQDGERAAGNPDMWGFVFPGKGNEGLTCTALEWIGSSGGGHIVDDDGTITINNEKAAAAIDRAAGWVGTISPPGQPSYGEEDARGVWQAGNAVFMRNWIYAYALGDAADSPIKGKFGAVSLPADPGEQPAPILAMSGNAVSKYSEHQKEAIELVKFLSSEEVGKADAIQLGSLPTRLSLYEDKDIIAAQPYLPDVKSVLETGVVRRYGIMKAKYNEASAYFWTAVNSTLAGKGTAADNLGQLEVQLTNLKGDGW